MNKQKNQQPFPAKLQLDRETLRALAAHDLQAIAGGTGNTCLHNLCYTSPSACPQNCKR